MRHYWRLPQTVGGELSGAIAALSVMLIALVPPIAATVRADLVEMLKEEVCVECFTWYATVLMYLDTWRAIWFEGLQGTDCTPDDLERLIAQFLFANLLPGKAAS